MTKESDFGKNSSASIVLGQVNNGDRVELLDIEYTLIDKYPYWYKIKTSENIIGCVYYKFVKLNNSIDEVKEIVSNPAIRLIRLYLLHRNMLILEPRPLSINNLCPLLFRYFDVIGFN